MLGSRGARRARPTTSMMSSQPHRSCAGKTWKEDFLEEEGSGLGLGGPGLAWSPKGQERAWRAWHLLVFSGAGARREGREDRRGGWQELTGHAVPLDVGV